MTVLIIDDDLSIRRLAGLFLGSRGGMTVLEAESGVAGILLAKDSRPDVILLDASMDDMDGPQTLAILKRTPETADVPVIFLTARTRPEDVATLSALDVLGVLAKPFNPGTLASEVRALLDDRC